MSDPQSSGSPSQIASILGPSCRDNARRALILEQTLTVPVNGIDYVEFDMVGVVPNQVPTLHIHFLLPLPVGTWDPVADPGRILIHGGTRIVGVSVVSAKPIGTQQVDVIVDEQGDFSPYLLTIGWTRDKAGAWTYLFDGLDRLFSVSPINFRPGCPVDFDCGPVDDCPPDVLAEPALDYLARDYASFRQLLIDLVAQRDPSWTERSPADLGMTLLELFAAEGDHLTYLQDAIANESYLDTARQRESAKRHARLVDYSMHDGRNAWTWVHFAVGGLSRRIPAHTQLVTRIGSPLRFDRQPGVTPAPQPIAPPGTEINPPSRFVTGDMYDDYVTDPALRQVRVFETATDTRVERRNNELRIHTWGNERCCMPRGTTSAHVFAVDATGTKAIRPRLEVGDLILLEEVLGPETGAAADADPAHRQVVTIVRVEPDPSTSTTGPIAAQMHDPLYLALLKNGELDRVTGAGPIDINDTLPLVEITWRPADALTFPLCLSTRRSDDSVIERISVARGNIAIADHGREVVEEHVFDPPFGGDRARVRLDQGPLTMACTAPDLACDIRTARPAIHVEVTRSTGGPSPWNVAPNLLGAHETDASFVADVDNTGRPNLRFGDGDYGRRLVDVRLLVATYRIGNGRAGNIGAEGLAHVVIPVPKPGDWPSEVMVVRNPLPARGGVDPESIEEVRQLAPAAFRAVQFRAVTEDDYRKAALTVAGVAGAVASFRWTGSWYTVFVGIDPADPDAILTDARGHTRLEPAFRQTVIDVLDQYRLAGYDLEIRSARYVPLDVTIDLCVKPGFFRGDVRHAVALALSGRAQPDGERGLFDAANLTFGQPVYLSRIYAAVEAVEGVDSADVRVFKRHDREAAGERDQGFIPIGAWEIAQLDNDPSRMESGTLTIEAAGGS